MKYKSILKSLIILSVITASNSLADVKIIPEKDKAIIIENETIKMVIDTDRGGRVVSFIHKPGEKDVVLRDERYMGLFADHIWSQGFPGELMEVPYEIEIIKNQSDEVRVKLWRKISGEWQGSLKKTLQGLIIEKTYILRAGVDAVFCNVVFKNPTGEGKLLDYWLQNVFYIGGDYNSTTDVFYRPSCRGVFSSAYVTFFNMSKDYVRDPYAGWSAGVDKDKKQSLIWLMDYNYLDILYDNGSNQTLEWIYDKIPIPAGKEWSTDVVLIPVIGMDNISHASKNLIAGLEVKRNGNNVELLHQFRNSISQIKNLKLSVEIFSITDNKKITTQPMDLQENLSTKVENIPQSIEFSYSSPLIVTVIAEGKVNGNSVKENWFVFYSGGYGFGGENLNPDTVTPLYKVERPEKKQELIRPEEIIRKFEKQPVVFIVQGLAADNFKVKDGLNLFKADFSYGFYNETGYAGSNISNFPLDYELLMKQDVIVIANANIKCLGKLSIEMLRDYVTHGGNLLFLGGKASYTAKGLIGSGIEDLLPIEIENNFNIEKVKNPYIFSVDSHQITKALGFSESEKGIRNNNPVCYFVHKVKIKKGAKILLRVENNPFLVIKEIEGGGRIACILGAPYGSKEGKNPVFFDWGKWSKLLHNILVWLSKR